MVRIFSRNRCPVGCKFCSSTNQITWGSGQKVPVISASEDTLIHNIKRIVEAHPRVRTVYLTDDDFCIVYRSVTKFCEKIIKLLKLTKRKIIEIRPDFVITIDAPGFNFRLQKSIKNLNLKRIHYVAPSVWAWKSYRAKKISKILDHLLVLYPFEKEYFTVHGLKTTFTGHPIAFDNKYSSNDYYFESSLKSKSSSLEESILKRIRK